MILPLILFNGCTALQRAADFTYGNKIGFPDGIDSSSFTEYSVSEIQLITKSINYANFGPYSVRLLRNGIKIQDNSSSGFLKSEYNKKASEKYNYELTGIGKTVWKGECVSSAHNIEKKSGLPLFEKEEYFYENFLQCKASNGEKSLNLKFESFPPEGGTLLPQRGYVESGGIRFDIEETMNTDKNYLLPFNIGFYIYDKGKLAAVVQNRVKGAVYISSAVDNKSLPLILNTAAILLTYYDLIYEVGIEEED